MQPTQFRGHLELLSRCRTMRDDTDYLHRQDLCQTSPPSRLQWTIHPGRFSRRCRWCRPRRRTRTARDVAARRVGRRQMGNTRGGEPATRIFGSRSPCSSATVASNRSGAASTGRRAAEWSQYNDRRSPVRSKSSSARGSVGAHFRELHSPVGAGSELLGTLEEAFGRVVRHPKHLRRREPVGPLPLTITGGWGRWAGFCQDQIRSNATCSPR
jgi:hypothetical protein